MTITHILHHRYLSSLNDFFKAFPMLSDGICRKGYWVVALMLFISGCAAQPITQSPYLSLESMPAFAVQGKPHIDPASDRYAIDDVDILALDDRMKEILDKSVIHIEDQKQRLESLLDVLYDNGLFNRTDEKYQTRTAIEAFTSGTGNCLSFSNTFVAMSRYVRLNARFQDVPTLPNWDQQGNIIFLNRHISVAVELYENVEYEIDFYFLDQLLNQREKYNITTRNQLLNLNERLTSTILPDKQAFAQYYNNKGSELLANGNMPDAFRYFVKAIKTDPRLSFIWSNLGAIYSQNNQIVAAEKAYKQSIFLDPYEFTAMSNLAKLYTRQGRIAEADAMNKKVRIFRNKNPYNHFAKGIDAFENHRYDESVAHFKRAIERKKDEHQFYFALAHAYVKLKNIKKAEDNIKKAIIYSPDKTTQDYYSQKWKILTGNPPS